MSDVLRILAQIELGNLEAAEAMRRILIERARWRAALKRGAGRRRGRAPHRSKWNVLAQ